MGRMIGRVWGRATLGGHVRATNDRNRTDNNGHYWGGIVPVMTRKLVTALQVAATRPGSLTQKRTRQSAALARDEGR